MSSQVEFFCSSAEELQVLEHVALEDGVLVAKWNEGRIGDWQTFAPEYIPHWPLPFRLIIWKQRFGDLVWHRSRPAITGPTHRSLVINLLSADHWDKHGMQVGDRLLDDDLSPLMYYQRGEVINAEDAWAEVDGRFLMPLAR